MSNQTDNHDLDVDYEVGDSWDYNDEMQTIELRLVVRDEEANRTDYTPHNEAIFIATDTGAVYDGDGEDWVLTSREYEATTADRLTLVPLDAEPSDPTGGMVACQNGTDWDPAGTGDEQAVMYLNDSWTQIS